MVATSLIRHPVIGSKGVFKLTSPFDSQVSAQDIYTCKAIRTLDEYIANGEDPWAKFYEPYNGLGVDTELYQLHLSVNESIVSLESEGGSWVYVPSSFLNMVPKVDGVVYVKYMLGIPLPPIPQTHDMSTMYSELVAVVQKYLNMAVEIKTTQVARPFMVTQDVHEAVIASRAINPNSTLIHEMTITQLNAKLAKITLQRDTLMQYIKNNP